MRCCLVFLVWVVLLAGSPARAQTTAAGVDAFLKGDFNTAAEILKPISERTFDRDQWAEFFMASLYEAGRGVPVDPVRACALYLRSADGPSQEQGVDLWRATRKTLTQDAADECNIVARIGLGHGFQPVTFMLEPGHWVSWTLRGATISYDGKERRVDSLTLLRGVRFLPIEHTELAVGPLRSTRRHFVEVFEWIPESRYKWTLSWTLSEVVRDQLVNITGDRLTTVLSEEPPTGPSFDIRRLVQIRTTDSGDAELAILAGSNPRTVVIETDDERQEVARRDAARKAADARVDWKRLRDVRRPPSFVYADANGCRGPFVYGWSEDRAEAISIRIDPALLQTARRPLNLSVQDEHVAVLVRMYEQSVHELPFCRDAITQAPPVELWTAVGGRVTVDISRVAARVRTPATERVTVRIDDAVFANSAGVRVRATQPIVLSVVLRPAGYGG